SIIVDEPNHYVFDKGYGGYMGKYWFFRPDLSIISKSLNAWVSDGFQYAVLLGNTVEKIKTSTNFLDNYLLRMLLLKSFPPTGEADLWQGPSLGIYRLTRIQNALRLEFEREIRLLGYAVTPTSPAQGDTLRITTYWNARQTPQDNYNLFL